MQANHQREKTFKCLLYTQITLRVLILFVLSIGVIYFLYLMRKEVNHNYQVLYNETFEESEECKKKYENSECEKIIAQNRRKSIQMENCLDWKKCMNEKPDISHLSLYGDAFGNFIKKVFHGFTYQTIFIIILIISGTIILLRFIS